MGFTADLKKRIKEHRDGKIKSTKKFRNFKGYVIGRASSIEKARQKEKYYKSHAGRRKLRVILENIKSSG